MRFRVQSLASLSGLRIWRGRELWYRSHTWLGSEVAVAVVQASNNSSDSTWEPLCAIGAALKRQKEEKKKGERERKGEAAAEDEEINYASATKLLISLAILFIPILSHSHVLLMFQGIVFVCIGSWFEKLPEVLPAPSIFSDAPEFLPLTQENRGNNNRHPESHK